MDVSVTGEQIRKALDALGIDVPLHDIREVHIGLSDITVVVLRKDKDGHAVVSHSAVMTQTTQIAIRW